MDKLETQLAQFENAQLVRRLPDKEQAYTFKHVLTQETAYNSLLLKSRSAIHRRVAQVYERLFAESLDEYVALLTQHYVEAGDDLKVLYYATRAGDVEAGIYANAEAIAHYSLVLQAAERSGATGGQLLHLFTKRGRAFELSDQFERALDNYQEMQTVALARGDRSLELEPLTLRTNLHATATPLFNPPQAQQLADQALALAHELGDRAAECKVLWNLLTLNRYTEQVLAAMEYGERALALALELNLREHSAFILTDLGGVCMEAGQIARAQVLLDQARSLWRELDNQPMLADNLMLSGTHALLKGDYDQSLLFTEEGIEISRKIGNVMSQSSNQGTQIQVWSDRGEFGRALSLADENVRMAEKANSHFMLALGYSMKASLYGTLGAFDRGLEMARLARKYLDQPMPLFFRAWVLTNLARLYCSIVDLTAAEEAIGESQLEPLANIMISPLALVGPIALGELALARGEFVRAVSAMDELAAKLRGLGVHAYLGDALYLEGMGLRGQGETAQALEILEQARAEAETRGSRRILWQILAALGEIEEEQGNEMQAGKLGEAAQAILTYIADHTPPELRASFLNLPQVRRVFNTS